jgi:dienelactone hydrolase
MQVGAALLALLAWAPAARAAEVLQLFPTDRLTVADPAQLTGRRIALGLPRCERAPSGCDEVRLLNELDGWSVSPRLALRFTAPVALDSITRQSAFLLPLEPAPGEGPTALGQLVWDPETRTLYARPERALLQSRRYALVVTARVLDAEGRPLKRGRGPLVSEARPGPPAEPVLLSRLEPLGIKRRDLAAAAVFTTRSVTADLEQMRALIEGRPAPDLSFTLGPGGERSVYLRSDLERVELRTHLGSAGLAEPRPLPLAAVPAAEVRAIAVGRFRSLSFLAADRHIPAWPSRSGAPRAVGEKEVHVTVFLPEGQKPPQGWPVAIFGHGFGGDRHLVPSLLAGALARHGFATVAINVVGHGGGPEGTLTLFRAGKEPAVLPAGGRGVDLDGDGRIGTTEGVSTLNSGPLAIVASRDGLRQTTADLMQLVRALRRGVDVDGDGQPDLDGERVHYVGQSFGGIYGTLLLAVDPLVPLGVLNVPGAPIVEVARQASVFRPFAVEQLRRRRPPLMNGDRDFVESIPLWGEPPVRMPARGALDIQAYFERVEWVNQPADPAAFAPYLLRAPLPGVGPKRVLLQMAAGDLTVPNPTTATMIRAGDLAAALSVYRHDRVAATLPERWRNPHGFLVWAAFPDVAAIGRAAQEQVVRFFLSGGQVIERTDPLFEVPAGQ